MCVSLWIVSGCYLEKCASAGLSGSCDDTIVGHSHTDIGHYGRMRKAYLEEHRPGLYTRLILSGMLYEHLAEADQVCRDRMERMIAQMAEAEGINEKLKASDQLGWISQMNSIRSQAEEIVLQEIIYS